MGCSDPDLLPLTTKFLSVSIMTVPNLKTFYKDTCEILPLQYMDRHPKNIKPSQLLSAQEVKICNPVLRNGQNYVQKLQNISKYFPLLTTTGGISLIFTNCYYHIEKLPDPL